MFLWEFQWGGSVVANYFALYPEDKSGAILIVSYDGGLSEDAIGLLSMMANTPVLEEYLESSRTVDVKDELLETSNHWLIFVGQDDNIVPVEGARAVADRLGDRAKLFEFEGLGHPLSTDGHEIISETIRKNVDFLTSV